MAHWIITDYGFNGQNYECSNCGSSWNDIFNDPTTWDKCPNCHVGINEDEEDECRSTKIVKAKALFRDLFDEELEFEELDFVPKHDTKNIVILSLEKYDQMKADFEQCIEERDKSIWGLEEELHNLYTLVKAIGITPEIAKNVYPDSVEILMDDNPINYTTRYHIKFDVRR